MALQSEDVVSLLGPFGEVLRVRESDAYLLGTGNVDCLEIMTRIKRGAKVSSLMSILQSKGYSVVLMKMRGKRLKSVLVESSYCSY